MNKNYNDLCYEKVKVETLKIGDLIKDVGGNSLIICVKKTSYEFCIKFINLSSMKTFSLKYKYFSSTEYKLKFH